LKYLLIFFYLLAPASLLGQDWYEIEVLIFEHQSNGSNNTSDPERWPANIDLFWPTPLIDISSSEDRRSASIVELSPQALRLDNASYAMRVNDDYRLLWHRAWKMPVLPEERSPWILIQGGDQVDEHHQLEGAIRIHLARFLHIQSNFLLTELLPPNSNEQTEFHWSQLPSLSGDSLPPIGPNSLEPSNSTDIAIDSQSSFRTEEQNTFSGTGLNGIESGFLIERGFPVKEIIHIQSSRRMRSKELHYIDHPKVGILAVIHPIVSAVEETKPIEYIPAPLPTIPNR